MNILSTGEQQVHFTKNEFVATIVQQLRTAPVNWKRAVEIYDEARNKHKRRLLLHQIHGLFMEIHVYLVILEIIKTRFDVFLKPISEGQRTNSFEFYTGKGEFDFNLRARRIEGRSDVAEYDLLLLQQLNEGTLPILLEVKIHKVFEEESDLALILNRSIIPQKIEDKFAPLVERFRTTTFAYIVVVAKDTPLQQTSYQREFLKRGGIFAPISLTYNEFLDKLRRLQTW